MSVTQVVPFLAVADIERSVQWYTRGVGFTMKDQWIDDGKLRWCWLSLGGAALMLQEIPAKAGQADGMTLYFICRDAVSLYRELRMRGIKATEPQVGNHMWVTELTDPDGYRLAFESPTDTAEETKLSEVE